MSTLLLRLASPLQSWGVDSKFDNRSSGTEPSKSGVVGMIAAALGRSRNESIDDLSALRMGVRIDQPGMSINDFHTAKSASSSYVTNRRYIADAVFVVGLEGDREQLEAISLALHSPRYPLFLGRRSCPLTGKVVLGIKDSGLEESLQSLEWQASAWYKRKMCGDQPLETVIESDEGYYVNDHPLSFSQSHREFSMRKVRRDHDGARATNHDEEYTENETTHDAFAVVRGD